MDLHPNALSDLLFDFCLYLSWPIWISLLVLPFSRKYAKIVFLGGFVINITLVALILIIAL